MRLALALALALTVPGCLSADPLVASSTTEVADLMPLPAADARRSLDEPPAWRTGEYWTLKVTAFGEEYTATRVVLGAIGERYAVGLPAEEARQLDPLVTLHLPAYGEVARDDLAFNVHDFPFAPVQFPLREGARWHTTFETLPLTATVVSVEGETAEIRYDGEFAGTATYDARIGELQRLVIDGYAVVEVVEHGFDYDGTVIWPREQDFLFIRGRAHALLRAEQIGPAPPEPGPPFESVAVDERFDRLSFNFFVGGLAGYFRERATAPDGTVYEHEVTPAETPVFLFPSYGHNAPSGAWELEHVAAGVGAAGTEAIGYQVYHVDLPSGRAQRMVGGEPSLA